MSAISRLGLRDKRRARAILERAARAEIDEFVRGLKPPIRFSGEATWEDDYELAMEQGLYEDYDDLDYYDDLANHYRGSHWDWDDSYDPRDDYDNYDDWYDYEQPRKPGTYYRDKFGITYLYCEVHGVGVYVNMLTGCDDCPNPFRLEKVG